VGAGDESGERRQHSDRREHSGGTGGERRGAKRATSTLTYVLRTLGAVFVLVLVIVYTVARMRPIYATRGTLGDELRKHAPGVASVIAPGDSTQVDRLMATQKFQDEKRNFYEDVMRLKQVDSARADSIAQFAVREAYVRGISPAIIFGVMLTENSRFVSKAQSNVGAVGLMQVYPKVWLTKEMTALFGKDLASDSTNVKYGVFILSHYFNPKVKGGGTTERDWATALLRYNGCVHGTNTPRCHTYPAKVQGFVENQAKSICDGRGFYDCIAKPFIDGLMKGGRLAPDEPKVDAAAAPTATATQAGQVTPAAPVPPVTTPPAATLPTPAPAPTTTSSTASKSSASTKANPKTSAKASPKAAKRKSKKPVPPKKKSAPKRAPVKHDPTLRAPKPIKITIP
jgi:hypothetical protein